MKKLRGSLAAKTTAIVLLCLLVLLFFASAAGAAALYELGAYSSGRESARQSLLNDLCEDRTDRAASKLVFERADPETVCAGENFQFVLYGPSGEEIYSNYDGGEVRAHATQEITDWRENPAFGGTAPTTELTPQPTIPVPTAGLTEDKEDEAEPTEEEEDTQAPGGTGPVRRTYRVEGYIPAVLHYDDEIKYASLLFEWGYDLRYAVYAIAGASLLLGVLLFVFLCSAAGHRDESETVTPNFVDWIPFDILTLIIGTGIIMAVAALTELIRFSGAALILGAVLILAAGLLFLLWCLSLATRVKLKRVWQSCLLYRLLSWCWRLLKRLGGILARAMRAQPLLRRWLIAIAAVLLLEFLLVWGMDDEASFRLFWFVEHLLLTAGLCYALLCMAELRRGAKKIAAGDESCTIDTGHMIGELKDHANDLNHIRDGLSAAVAEKMKSERFRTELITNVSHDIKTPLTSIVNYVDLLSREEPENEKSREYLEVLQRQSAKLKKLTEDLVEASKASTGALSVVKTPCDLSVLLEQTAGEYGERLTARQLDLILCKPDEPAIILADGRHMWRIFDNLMGNILKYAKPGTRVYLDLERQGAEARVSFRNISEAQLNISGEELMERFVRGDSARSSEGSGLGLAIARSLTELQGGKMDLTVDGDLFKVVLLFPAGTEE